MTIYSLDRTQVRGGEHISYGRLRPQPKVDRKESGVRILPKTIGIATFVVEQAPKSFFCLIIKSNSITRRKCAKIWTYGELCILDITRVIKIREINRDLES